MTDNDAAEIGALTAIYALALLYLCSWHIEQAVIRNIAGVGKGKDGKTLSAADQSFLLCNSSLSPDLIPLPNR